jgi:hypothetical protein
MPAEHEPGEIIPVTPSFPPISFSAPQMEVRFVLRDGKRILQQLWVNTKYEYEGKLLMPVPRHVSTEWRDVPLVTEGE